MSRSDMSIVNELKLDDQEWITLWSSHRLVCAQTIIDLGSSITMGISPSNEDQDRTYCEQEKYLELKQNEMHFFKKPEMSSCTMRNFITCRLHTLDICCINAFDFYTTIK